MDKLLCRTVALLSVFALFGPNVAMPRNADPDTDPDPSDSGAPEALNGSPADNGHLSGQAEQAKYQQQEEQRQEDKKQDGDQHREETRIQEQEIAFLEWVKEFQEIGQQPHRAPLVKEYMRENNLTIHDVKTMYGIEPSNPDRKRSAAITIAGIWNKCIIPYTFSDTLHAYCPVPSKPSPSGACHWFGTKAVQSLVDGFDDCFKYGGYLVGIDTEAEYNEIIQHTDFSQPFDGFWTGANHHSSGWLWVKADAYNEFYADDMNFTFWAQGEDNIENDPDQEFADIRKDFKLYSDEIDFVPSNGISYICEQDPIDD